MNLSQSRLDDSFNGLLIGAAAVLIVVLQWLA